MFGLFQYRRLRLDESAPRSQDRTSLFRRGLFAFGTTVVCFALVTFVLVAGLTSTMAEKVVMALMSYAELMAMLYLGASVIDRTQMIDKIGARVNPGPMPPDAQPYPGEQAHTQQYTEHQRHLQQAEYPPHSETYAPSGSASEPRPYQQDQYTGHERGER